MLSPLVASLLLVLSDCTLRTHFANPFNSLPGGPFSVITDYLSNSGSLRATSKQLKEDVGPLRTRNLTKIYSLLYIDSELFRAEVDATLPNPRQQIRLNLGRDFETYMTNANYRDFVNALVAEPLTQIWSDVTQLDFWYSDIHDIGPLAAVVNLEWLNLTHNPVQDISSLKGLTKLYFLDLTGTAVHDISPIAARVNLKYLNLSSTDVQDISPLAALGNLEWLNLSRTPVQNIRPLEGRTSLIWLYLSRTPVQDISPLLGLTNLTKLGLVQTPVQDLVPLERLRAARVMIIR